MGAHLTIESELDRAWRRHGEAHRQAVADRDHFATETQDRFGPVVAAAVQRHVDVALGCLLADDLLDLDPAAERRFHELLALERAVLEIEAKIESGSVFFDPYNEHGLFPMSWWRNIMSLLSENPGYMRVKNVEKFVGMVKSADQRLPSGDAGDGTAEHFWKRRQELIEFLGKAVELDEAVWCDL